MVKSLLRYCMCNTLMFSAIIFMICACSSSYTFKDVFEIPKPENIELINEICQKHYFYKNYYYWGKFKGTEESYYKLVEILQLTKAEKAYILEPLSENISWWVPPNFEEQLNCKYTFYKDLKHKTNPELNIRIVAQYHSGYIYITKAGY